MTSNSQRISESLLPGPKFRQKLGLRFKHAALEPGAPTMTEAQRGREGRRRFRAVGLQTCPVGGAHGGFPGGEKWRGGLLRGAGIIVSETLEFERKNQFHAIPSARKYLSINSLTVERGGYEIYLARLSQNRRLHKLCDAKRGPHA